MDDGLDDAGNIVTNWTTEFPTRIGQQSGRKVDWASDEPARNG
jgi:hypothetical protein